MLMGSTAITRTMQAALDLAEVTVKAGETISAAGAVIAARFGIMSAALRDPLNADHAELGRMLPEKMRAFAESGAAVIEEWWALNRDVWAYARYLARATTTGRAPSASAVLEFVERTSAHGARLASSAIDAATVALAPLHQKATSNARRLARRKRRA